MSTLGSAVRASASALAAERMRIEVAVSNLANAESTRGPDGQPYKRRDVVLQSASVQDFDNSLGRASAVGVEVAAVVEDQGPARRRYEPSHPDADKDGYVSLPNVEPAGPASHETEGLAARADGNTVQIDRELLSMTQAAGEFARAQTALAAKFRLVRYAINEAR